MSRIKYAFALLPAAVLSFVLSGAFSGLCAKQIEYSTRLKVAYIPLALASLDNWAIFFFLCCSIVAMLWPFKGHPVLAFGCAFGILFPAVFSPFIGYEIKSSGARLKTTVENGIFKINTTYQRMITQNLLVALDTKFQKEYKCCGLRNYSDYCDNSTLSVTPDNQHDMNMGKREAINVRDYLHGIYGKKEGGNYTHADFAIPPDQDLPDSCCKDIEKCKVKVCSDSPSLPEDGIFTEGCGEKILKPLSACMAANPISFVFPWIAFSYSVVITWANLRKSQGFGFKSFGSQIIPKTEETSEQKENDKKSEPEGNSEPGNGTATESRKRKSVANTKSLKSVTQSSSVLLSR